MAFCSRAAGRLCHRTLPPAGLAEWLQLQATGRKGWREKQMAQKGLRKGGTCYKLRHMTFGSVHTWEMYL